MQEKKVYHYVATRIGDAPVRDVGADRNGAVHRVHDGRGGGGAVAADLIRRRAAVCESCDQLNRDAGGVRLNVNGREVNRVSCKACGCGGLSLIDGKCPRNKWDAPTAPGPALTFKTADGKPVTLQNLYAGRSAFLVLGGPSVKQLDLSPLRAPGILTMGVNNSPATFRPNIWTHFDVAGNFLRSIYYDPTIIKLVPWGLRRDTIFDSDAWKMTERRPIHCPGVFFYDREPGVSIANYLTGPVSSGDDTTYGKSVMISTFRLLYELGVRRVFLLGADFTMSKDYTYHFNQSRGEASVAGNQRAYRALNSLFTKLRPVFDAAGFKVLNCNPQSRLWAFDHLPYDKAIAEARAEFGVDPATERVADLYDKTVVK